MVFASYKTGGLSEGFNQTWTPFSQNGVLHPDWLGWEEIGFFFGVSIIPAVILSGLKGCSDCSTTGLRPDDGWKYGFQLPVKQKLCW